MSLGSLILGILGSLKRSTSAFTLTELLIVVAIMTIITTASVVGVIDASRRAGYERARKDVLDLQSAIEIARLNSGDVLMGVTGNGCTECACRQMYGFPLSDLTDQNSLCWTNYRNTIDRINVESGDMIKGYPADPCGHPYQIDENELEFAANPCRQDIIYVHSSCTGRTFDISIPFISPACR